MLAPCALPLGLSLMNADGCVSAVALHTDGHLPPMLGASESRGCLNANILESCMMYGLQLHSSVPSDVHLSPGFTYPQTVA